MSNEWTGHERQGQDVSSLAICRGPAGLHRSLRGFPPPLSPRTRPPGTRTCPAQAAASPRRRAAPRPRPLRNDSSARSRSPARNGSSPTTIVSYIQLRAGQPYTAAAADQALKDLAATELFADDRDPTTSNGDVVITVSENPVINRIVLEGNKRLKDDKILPEIKLAPRQIFTRSKVRADVARIIELYKRQGRFAATVEPKMVQLDQNRVDVVFEINEGPKSKVRAINIIGNEVFSDGKLRGRDGDQGSRAHQDLQPAPATTPTAWPTTSRSCASST